MRKSEEILQLIDNYIELEKDSYAAYCIHPYKQRYCGDDCQCCKDTHYENMRKDLMERCGVSDES